MLETYKTSTFLHHQPHEFLGRHPLSQTHDIFVTYRPGFNDCYVQIEGQMQKMHKGDHEGIFYLDIPVSVQKIQVYHTCGLLHQDPYSFDEVMTDLDQFLFSKGVHYKLYEKLGSFVTEVNGVKGTVFSVWAPNAASVCLMADFNHFCVKTNPMRSLGPCGVWELFVPGIQEGEKYKFCIKTHFGEHLIKTDPMAKGFELRPNTAAIVTKSYFTFTDESFLERKKSLLFKEAPFNCYEVHLGSWKKGLNYEQLAFELGSYVKDMGYTHVELLPIMEHPLDESWGYQVTGFFAPTARFGTLDEFKFFVNHLHQEGIGVILDWVPAHFPQDSFALAKFDGTALYEHHDPQKGYHPDWHTLIFNYARHEVQNFLIASALFWLEECHIDGLRVDAVASMLYLDYGRQQGQWTPNCYGGKDNLEAIEFLKHLNSIVHQRCPEAIMIAEESTSFFGVTHSLDQWGLGFDLKWNMGWMNDTLKYFTQDPFFRKYHHNLLTFGPLYAFAECFQYVLSHDEVVHGKRSLLSKMPGDMWQKFANLRLLIAYMMTQPGKKLLFMGSELGEYEEWDIKRSLSWHLLAHKENLGLKTLIKDLNHLYLNLKALHECDHSWEGFEWVLLDDKDNSVIAYLRKSKKEKILCVFNFTPQVLHNYIIYVPGVDHLKLIFNSDSHYYSGSNYFAPYSCEKSQGFDNMKVSLTLPPLSALLFDTCYER